MSLLSYQSTRIKKVRYSHFEMLQKKFWLIVAVLKLELAIKHLSIDSYL